MIYAPAKFAVPKTKGLGGDAFTKNVTEGRTDGGQADFGTKLIKRKEKSEFKKQK